MQARELRDAFNLARLGVKPEEFARQDWKCELFYKLSRASAPEVAGVLALPEEIYTK